MSTVGQVCNRRVIQARPRETILTAARRMRDEHVGCLVVVDQDASGERVPVGVLTDRDIVVRVVAAAHDASELTVADAIRGQRLVFAFGGEDVGVALERMKVSGVRRLPVVDPRNQLEGILSYDDLLGAIAGDTSRLVALVAREQRVERLAGARP